MTENRLELSRIIAELVKQQGGTAYYVGGFVRDKLLEQFQSEGLQAESLQASGLQAGDIDIEVHDVSPEDLVEVLASIGAVERYGASFGIYTLRGSGIDIAMPRRERLKGDDTNSHRNFEVDVDPHIGTREAARRRDFTINALMEDVLTGEIVDEFGGMKDLKAGVLRHVDSRSFPEDPLRVLRGAQFAARFGFRIADETLELCRGIDLAGLSRERVEDEMKKALLKSGKPSIFFENLRAMDQLKVWFPELQNLIGLEQDPVFHPEGDVWTHTMEAVDRAAALRAKVEQPYAFMLLALTHDLGKAVTTEFLKGRWHAYDHENQGVPIAGEFLHRLVGDKSVRGYVLNMIPLHMRPNVIAKSRSSLKSSNRMFDEAASALDLMYFAQVDKPVVAGTEAFEGDPEFLLERYNIYKDIMAKPCVMGKDLIEAGFQPDEDFKEGLEYARKLRLAGIEKDIALKQVLGYMAQLRKKKSRSRQ